MGWKILIKDIKTYASILYHDFLANLPTEKKR